MHELSATESILSLVIDEAAKAGASRITRISLKIGEWSTFVPDSVQFCFELISGGTPAEGAELAIEQVPVEYKCDGCGFEFAPQVERLGCPKCAGTNTRLVSGREFYIDSIEVDGEYSGSTQSS
jgi:hydrogenase nickel incorporation protein HypA/HybF